MEQQQQPSYHREEEYTDYSCSTAVERLSRDVETALRSWHVDNGSDHHVSAVFTPTSRRSSASGNGSSCFWKKDNNNNPRSFKKKATTTSSSMLSSSSSTSSLPRVSTKTSTNTDDDDVRNIRLIRSKFLPWTLTLNTQREGRCTVTVDLELALWDAPTCHCDDDDDDKYIDDETGHDMDGSDGGCAADGCMNIGKPSRLVRSLRRKQFGTMPAHGFLFDNFSTLFGIGQHITLSPVQPEPIPYPLLEVLVETSATQHDTSAARWIWANLLSNWLQTSLNIASSNCKSCIPTFGVWGEYRPNHIVFPEPTPRTSGVPTTKPTPRSSSSGTFTSMSSQQTTGSQQSPNGMSSSISRGKSNNKTPGVSSSNDGLVGKTIETEFERRNKQLCNKYKGVLFFPQWAQACKNINLPTELAGQMRQRLMSSFATSTTAASNFASSATPKYAPPFFVGSVLAPFQIDYGPYSEGSGGHLNHQMGDSSNKNFPVFYRTGANMWVSAFVTNVHSNSTGRTRSSKSSSSAASVLVGRPRLSVWAGVLLQHCPDDTKVVLVGGRHVFGWFKERPDEQHKGSKGGLLSSLARAAANSGGSGSGLYYRNDSSGISKWRMGAYEDEDIVPSIVDLTEDFVRYRKECQEVARDIIEEAWGCKDRRMPLWGSIDDPVASIYATITWSGKSSKGDQVLEPLLSFPLRIRSRRELSRDDYVEMEDSIEKSILDPMNPSRFCVQAFYDRDTSVSTLAANVRCVLAAMIRAATLPDETLLHHLTDMDLIQKWDDAAGRQVAKKLAQRANVGNGTLCIVEAMDWSTSMEEFISVREAEYAVHNIMNSSLTAGFPSCPDDSFNEHDHLFPLRKSAPVGRLLSALFAHMARLRALSSVALVWRVFCHELRRRFDAKESLPNMQYVPGLDPHPLDLYEKRCFSTIGLKANFSAFLNCTEPDPDDFNCLVGQKLQVFNLGVECIVARDLLESEALESFLGAGKLPASLKVGNIDSEMKDGDVPSVEGTLGELSEHFQADIMPNKKTTKKWPKANIQAKISNAENEDEEKTNYGPPTIDRDLDFWVMDEGDDTPAAVLGNIAADVVDDTGFDYVAPPSSDPGEDDDSATNILNGTQNKKLKKVHKEEPKKPKSGIIVEGLPNQTWEGTVMDGSERSSGSGGTLSQVYHDAAEAGSIFSTKNGFVSMDTVVNISNMKHRPGARCPVQGEGLAMTGDQLYAPYLQRPYPVTDDVAMERRVMLAQSGDSDDKRGVLQSRLEIAHRLQRPKLVSDMCAFKAANPKCTLDDFTKWYGNPGSPLDEYNEDNISDEMSVQDAYNESAARKLDKASEAMRVLVSTRDFWGKAWEEATSVPAAEQEPLFDYQGTVEMVLDYLEQLHPASLMNQVMAVNLSSAYFALASSAKGTMKIGIVQLSMKRLRQKIEKALNTLARDSTGSLGQSLRAGVGSGSTTASTTTSHFASEESISSCEDACNALGVTETMVARATSLLDKFPHQYGLVSDLLRFTDGSTLGLTSREGRITLLNTILEQQQKRKNVSADDMNDGLPSPMLREYVFRNLNDDSPSQLAVRFGDQECGPDHGENEGGVLLALMKSQGDDDE